MQTVKLITREKKAIRDYYIGGKYENKASRGSK